MTIVPDLTQPSSTEALERILRTALTVATTALDVSPTATAQVFGWRHRSIGARVETTDGDAWLRVVWARPEWAKGSWWCGNSDAGVAIVSVSSPTILNIHEWRDDVLAYRAELMTVMPGLVIAPTPDLRRPPGLNRRWWADLHASIDRTAAVTTTRKVTDQATISHRVPVFFGTEIDTLVTTWQPAHGDLHWNNVFSNPFGVVDWEAWGLAPRGFDAAFLLCHSLAEPATAVRIQDEFQEDLNSTDGVISQLYVMTRLLSRVDGGDYRHLLRPIHRHVDRLLGRRVPSKSVMLISSDREEQR